MLLKFFKNKKQNQNQNQNKDKNEKDLTTTVLEIENEMAKRPKYGIAEEVDYAAVGSPVAIKLYEKEVEAFRKSNGIKTFEEAEKIYQQQKREEYGFEFTKNTDQGRTM